MPVDSIPTECPQCHHHIHAIFQLALMHRPEGRDPIILGEAVFKCPRNACQLLFIATYVGSVPNNTSPQKYSAFPMALLTVQPQTTVLISFPPEITVLSPTFVTIYNQANSAEAYQLDDIAGSGYRKSLEFLVKDYLIRLHPEDAEAIKKEFLGSVIKNRVEDPNIKRVAERAVWLGNDETHYERRWVDKDIDDLKRLITLTVNWITNHLMTEAAFMDMPSPK
jgi:hypothetical protein